MVSHIIINNAYHKTITEFMIGISRTGHVLIEILHSKVYTQFAIQECAKKLDSSTQYKCLHICRGSMSNVTAFIVLTYDIQFRNNDTCRHWLRTPT